MLPQGPPDCEMIDDADAAARPGRLAAAVCAAALLVTALSGCVAPSREAAPAGIAAVDPHSWSRPDQVRVTAMTFDWTIRFDAQVIEGSVVLRLERGPRAASDPLRLDTRDLAIGAVAAGRLDGGGRRAGAMRETTWRLSDRDPILGSGLEIDLPAGADAVRIEYRTSPEATGLQWLDPEQTAGRRAPFLYTQSQPIHARSWFPCQDSPGARMTFEGVVRVPPPLTAVMAAVSKGNEGGAWSFAMPHPVPPYLVALAAGDLTFAETGPRTGVWAEPATLPAAAREFADMEAMLAAAEELYGAYRWGRYDLLILPPSFPVGGMENPMLTFATPTVIAGDRSLVSLVAHELAHSWSGNLVTNATWGDSWLNEGVTTYIERRIMERIFGEDRAGMEWMLGRQDLQRELARLATRPEDQALRIRLAGRDPDDAGWVAYEKGALFLRTIEETYGREAFDAFLKSWFDDHAFASVTTDDFIARIDERLLSRVPPVAGRARPDLAAWIDGPGVPADAPRFTAAAFDAVDAQARRWADQGVAARDLDTAGWDTHRWLHFLRALPADIGPRRMRDLDAAFGFTRAGNAEILEEWLLLSLRHGYEEAYGRVDAFLTSQGRQKYLEPLYQEMMKSEPGAAMARDIYARARPLYHPLARKAMDAIVLEERPASAVGSGGGP